MGFQLDLNANEVNKIAYSFSRYVDWEEFLENEALYIIASRPNLPFALLMKTRNEGVQQRAEAK